MIFLKCFIKAHMSDWDRLKSLRREELIRCHSIARQSGLATVDQEHIAVLTVQTEIGQKHVLVIAFQKHPFDPV